MEGEKPVVEFVRADRGGLFVASTVLDCAYSPTAIAHCGLKMQPETHDGLSRVAHERLAVLLVNGRLTSEAMISKAVSNFHGSKATACSWRSQHL